MIALSTRHTPWLLVLLGAALLPIALEELRPRRSDDCRNPDMLTLTLAIPGSKPARSAGKRHAPPDDAGGAQHEKFILWAEGEIENPRDGADALRFWIVRSFDPGVVSPRSMLQGAFDPESHEVREIESEMGPLPVHVAVDKTRPPGRLVAWAWVYDGRPAVEIFPALLRTAPRRLLEGAPPVTLFLVDGGVRRVDTGAAEATATKWIADAWSHMARYCR